MGRLVLIILLLFSVTAIYSEARAGGQQTHSLISDYSTKWGNSGAACPDDRPLFRRND